MTHSSQRGLLPNVLWLIGCLLIFIPVYGLFVIFPDIIVEAKRQPTSSSLVFFIAQFVLQEFIFFAFSAYLSLFVFKMFPSLAVTADGISCVYLPGMLVDFFKWSEIRKISARGDNVFLVIFRPGLPLFNGLHINSFYGRIFGFGVANPVLLLSPALENREKMLQEIRTKAGL